MTVQAESNNHVRIRGLRLARLAWITLTLLMLGTFVAAVPARYQQLRTVAPTAQRISYSFPFVVSPEPTDAPLQLAPADEGALRQFGITVDTYARLIIGLEIAFVLACALMGVVLFWRGADSRSALYTSFALVTLGLAFPPTLNALAQAGSAQRLLVAGLEVLRWVCAGGIFFLFPDGRFTPRWTRPVLGLVAIWLVLAISVPAARLDSWPLGLRLLGLLGLLGLAAFAQIYRYRWVSTPAQRQQTKWVMFGMIAAFLVRTVLNVAWPGPAFALLGVSNVWSAAAYLGGVLLFYLALFLGPLTITLAVLRYRLWDVDLLIRRTLIYATLTGALGLIYLGSVVLLQAVVNPRIGQQSSSMVIVVSTLAIAALFTPLRMRIQAAIDRRFYRRKYDAAKTLAALSAQMRDEVELEKLMANLLTVVEETMQPAHASLWLRRAEPRVRRDMPKGL
jgi:hypothetical protein